MSLYNNKTHGGLDIELHQLFEDAGIGDVVFCRRSVDKHVGWDLHASTEIGPWPFLSLLFQQGNCDHKQQ